MLWYWYSDDPDFKCCVCEWYILFKWNPHKHNFRTYDGSGKLCPSPPRGGSQGQVATGGEYRLPPRKFKGGRCPIVLLSCPSAICTFVPSQQSRAVVRPALLPPPHASFALVQIMPCCCPNKTALSITVHCSTAALLVIPYINWSYPDQNHQKYTIHLSSLL